MYYHRCNQCTFCIACLKNVCLADIQFEIKNDHAYWHCPECGAIVDELDLTPLAQKINEDKKSVGGTTEG